MLRTKRKLPAEELKERIARAFARVQAPPKQAIARPHDWDARAITKEFAPFLTQPVPAAVLESHAKSLPAFTPRAFVFFLKDYLRYSLDHPDTELTEHLIYRLSSVKPEEPYWIERMNLFSDAQREVIADCCTFLMDQMPKAEAFLRDHLQDAIRAWGRE